MQIQLQSQGVDIQVMKSRMDIILQVQDEMKLTINMLLERSKANQTTRRGTSGTPNSGIITPQMTRRTREGNGNTCVRWNG